MLLNIYLITTGFSYLYFISFAKTCVERVKAEGYSFRKPEKKRSILSKLRSILKIMFVFSIPGLNFFSALWYIANKEEVYQQLKNKDIDSGDIYKVDSNNNDCLSETDVVIEDTKTKANEVLLKNKENNFLSVENQDKMKTFCEDILDLPSCEQGQRLIKQKRLIKQNKYNK